MMATAFLTVLHWDQARAIFGWGDDPGWRLRAKRRGVSARYRLGELTAVGGLIALPYAEEMVRCLRVRRS
jgi:hypothetical protein